MHLYIQFPDFSNTMAIDQYIEDRLKGIQQYLDVRHHDAKITLRGIVLGRKAKDGEAKMFEAEILVKIPRSKKPFVVKKKGTDFRTAISDAADAMETLLHKDAEIKEHGRKTVGKTHRTVRQVKHSGILSKKKKKA